MNFLKTWCKNELSEVMKKKLNLILVKVCVWKLPWMLKSCETILQNNMWLRKSHRSAFPSPIHHNFQFMIQRSMLHTEIILPEAARVIFYTNSLCFATTVHSVLIIPRVVVKVFAYALILTSPNTLWNTTDHTSTPDAFLNQFGETKNWKKGYFLFNNKTKSNWNYKKQYEKKT